MNDTDRYRPRYRPRDVTDATDIPRFLRRHPWGVLTTVDDDEPVPTPLLYVYDRDAHAIDTHVSPDGRTASLAREGTRGSFVVATMGSIIPAAAAGDFDLEYESVVAYGDVELLEGNETKRDALRPLMEKFAPTMTPGDDYHRMNDTKLEETAVVRLSVDEWSAKRNRAEPDDASMAFDPNWHSESP